MVKQADEVKGELQKRLRRIEGQVRGVQKMLDDGRDCREVLQQMSAIRSAVQNATNLYVRSYTKDCLRHDLDDDVERERLIDDLVDLMSRVN